MAISKRAGYAPFTYQVLVEFIIVAEDVFDSLGEDQDARQEAAHQLIYDVLVEPAEHVCLWSAMLMRINR